MTERLLLDELFSPRIAAALAERGHDVVAVAADGALRSQPDEEVYRVAAAAGRRVVTENIPDFKQLHSTEGTAALLCVSSRSFSRSRQREHVLVSALHAWLTQPDAAQRAGVEWLTDVR